MNRTILIAIGLAAAVLAAVFLGANTVASPPGVDGTIAAIDASSHRISVVDDDTQYWFGCTPDTKITLNGYAATFDQLAVGQKVKVSFDPYSNEALQVDAMPRPDR